MTSPATILHTAFPLGSPLLYTVIAGHVTYQRLMKIRDEVSVCHPEIHYNNVCKRSSGCINYDNYVHVTQRDAKMYLIATQTTQGINLHVGQLYEQIRGAYNLPTTCDRILVTHSSSTSRDHMMKFVVGERNVAIRYIFCAWLCNVNIVMTLQ